MPTNDQIKASIHNARVMLGGLGLIPSTIDAELGAARAGNPPVDGNPHVQAAHGVVDKLGKDLELLAKYLAVVEAQLTAAPAAPTVPKGPNVEVFKKFSSENINGDPVKLAAFLTQYGLTTDELHVWMGYWQSRVVYSGPGAKA